MYCGEERHCMMEDSRDRASVRTAYRIGDGSGRGDVQDIVHCILSVPSSSTEDCSFHLSQGYLDSWIKSRSKAVTGGISHQELPESA